MTNETAIHRLLLVKHRKDCTELLAEALDMAIEALSCSEPKTAESGSVDSEIPEIKSNRTTGGMIYRQDAIDALTNDVPVYGILDDDGYIRTGCMDKDVIAMLASLPSAQPEQNGWVHIDDIYRLISGHSNYHGDNILAALTCLAEGKEVLKPITVLDAQPEKSTRKLIYLDDAIDAIKMLLEQSEDDEHDRTWNNAIRGAINAVKHHLPSAQQWIPVSERLPEKDGDYLVTFQLLWLKPIEVCHFENGVWDKGNYEDVLAWQELPEPYRGDK